MSAPDKDARGIRWYGGSTIHARVREDPTRCIETVASYIGQHIHSFNQCSRKRVNGEWCKQHHPDTKKARDDAAKKRYDDHLSKMNLQWSGPEAIKALIAIANDHNDPCALARKTLKDRGIKWEVDSNDT